MEFLNKLYSLSATQWLIIIGGLTTLLKFLEAVLKIDGPVTIFFRWLSKPFLYIKSIKNSVEALEPVWKLIFQAFEHQD